MKTHLSLSTNDLPNSVAFYRALLNLEPAKHYDDYALFLSQDPGLELALNRQPGVGLNESAHFGIAVDTTQAVEETMARLESARLRLDVQTEETCCYAKQTKAWATDPDGRRWEVYTVLEETEERESPERGCCADTGDENACCSAA